MLGSHEQGLYHIPMPLKLSLTDPYIIRRPNFLIAKMVGLTCHIGRMQLVVSANVTYIAYCKKWNQIYKYRREGNRAQLLNALADAFAGFVGATDVTAIDFIPELMELYPEAKVVLVTRDHTAWWKSFKPVADNAGSKLMGYILMPLPSARWFVDTARGFFEAYDSARAPIRVKYWLIVCRAEDRTGRECNPLWIEQHNEYVRKIVPKERLLEVELGSGWEPLCRFLGKPIPTEPFPHANEAAARDRFAKRILQKAAIAWTGLFATLGLVSYLAWRLRRPYS